MIETGKVTKSTPPNLVSCRVLNPTKLRRVKELFHHAHSRGGLALTQDICGLSWSHLETPSFRVGSRSPEDRRAGRDWVCGLGHLHTASACSLGFLGLASGERGGSSLALSDAMSEVRQYHFCLTRLVKETHPVFRTGDRFCLTMGRTLENLQPFL